MKYVAFDMITEISDSCIEHVKKCKTSPFLMVVVWKETSQLQILKIICKVVLK
jgi:hypothetical protein